MIEMKIKISKVDYGKAVDRLMPVLMEKVEVSGNPIASAVLGRAKGLPAGAAKAALDILPQKAKDELAVACLNHYSDELSKLMVELARQKDISVSVEGIEAAVHD